MKKAAQRIHEKSLPRSNIAKACAYLLSHWEPLMRTLENGRARLDTNLVENSIQQTALGKRNWMFIGRPAAGYRSAILYSLIISCQRRGIDPAAYLRDVLSRLPAMTNQDNLGALTPTHWTKRA